ncbi:hypothetical protein FB567DRAFT_549760 [Paraphoma chrysanthemicola]|uniref:Uncharacterized protein n=1 Tax=Paraphoma chrysanthemicola TaxID=798071 RepID=A0A8K0R3D8_9PLEO|nr:hypothetical protein FB567DRAFT_549760 [Paraphoma chrysanthemicola]
MPLKKSKSSKSSSRGQPTGRLSKYPAGPIQGLSSTSAAKTLKRLTVDEGKHDDDEMISPARFPFKQLIPNWVNLDVHTKNAATGSTFTKSHHTPDVGAKTKKCFENFIFAFCLEWEWDDKDKEWRRRYNQFCVDSQQCTTHPKTIFKDGYNQIWREMKEGRTGNWGMLRNNNLKGENGQLMEMTVQLDLRTKKGENSTVAWKEPQAKQDEQKRIAKKIQREVASGKSTSAEEAPKNSVISNTREGKSRKTSSKSDDGRPDLDAKSALNPNQRGKKSGKAITKACFAGGGGLATIEEEQAHSPSYEWVKSEGDLAALWQSSRTEHAMPGIPLS